jgi:hypothetical protein
LLSSPCSNCQEDGLTDDQPHVSTARASRNIMRMSSAG